MYCINCGQSIIDTAKFCPNCGKAQYVEHSDTDGTQIAKAGEVPKNALALNIVPISKMGLFSKIPIWYWVWVTIHLIILLVFSSDIFDGESTGLNDFWPFDSGSGAYRYDITEFLVYTLLPLIFILLRKTKTVQAPQIEENNTLKS